MDFNTQPQSRTSLPVLPHSGRVQQLREEASAGAVSTATAGATTSHVNRLEAEGREPEGLEGKVVAALRSVYDPEIPINIYELGLVYDIQIAPDNSVRIIMTLTAPGCPVAGSLPPEVETRVDCIPEVKGATVELVWEPAWCREMMSEVARLELGM